MANTKKKAKASPWLSIPDHVRTTRRAVAETKYKYDEAIGEGEIVSTAYDLDHAADEVAVMVGEPIAYGEFTEFTGDAKATGLDGEIWHVEFHLSRHDFDEEEL